MPEPSTLERLALLSEDGRHRYILGRRWDPSGAKLLAVCMNPSTADAEVDDPTTRRLVGFAKEWGFGQLAIVNAFSLRSKDPRDALAADDAVGPDNDEHIKKLASSADMVLCAWGDNVPPRRAAELLPLLSPVVDQWPFIGLYCLAVNKSGAPKHPLYVRADVRPIRWPQL